MITAIQVKNFRSMADVNIKLAPLTVLVGQNGSGKSSLIDVLRFVSDALLLGLKTAITKRSGMSALRRWSAKGRPFDLEVRLSMETNKFSGIYHFVLGSERKGEYTVKEEDCLVRSKVSENFSEEEYIIRKGIWEKAPTAISAKIQSDTLMLPLISAIEPFDRIYDFLTGMSFYTIFPRSLRDHQDPMNPYPLEEDGKNLASLLQQINESSEIRAKLKTAIQQVIPDVDDFQVRQAGPRLVVRLHHSVRSSNTEDDEKAPWFELAQESDGTLRMLALLAALYQEPPRNQPKSPRTLIALEEPELTVHPGVMAMLWEEILAASERVQVIITTHSPDLLDLANADQLRVVEKENGITQIGPIDKAQKEIIRSKLFTPGQLMQAQGLRIDIEAEQHAQ